MFSTRNYQQHQMSPEEAYKEIYGKLSVDQVLYFINCSEDVFDVVCHGCNKAVPRSGFLEHQKDCEQHNLLQPYNQEEIGEADHKKTNEDVHME